MRALVLGTFLLIGCGDDPMQPPMEGLHPSVIEWEGQPSRIAVPGVVNAGEPFIVRIETFGGPGWATELG